MPCPSDIAAAETVCATAEAALDAGGLDRRKIHRIATITR